MDTNTDKWQKLHEVYHEKIYSQTNVLDGEFRGMMKIYDIMYGRYMPVDRKARIADLACGAGQFLKYCLNKGYGYHDVIGIELSSGQVAYVQENVTKNIALMDAFLYLDSCNACLDLVVGNDFIEHLTKERGVELVSKAFEALTPGGRLILKTGNMAAFGGLVMWCSAIDHECGYTERSLYNLLAMNGFEQIEIIPYYERRNRWKLKLAHAVMRRMYKTLYGGKNCPKVFTKVIAVTGVKP